MRRRAHVDLNQGAIVEALRAAGATVQSLASVGNGCPDLLVGYGDRNFLFEVKNPKQKPSDRRLTAAEGNWITKWRGGVDVVETAELALTIIGAKQPTPAVYRPGRKP